MAVRTHEGPARVPEWVVAEMPPGYETRLSEIRRLSADLDEMDGIGRVLWEKGEPLRHAVRAVFGAVKCEVEPAPDPAGPIVVKIGGPHRLVVLVSEAAAPLRKADEDLARVFRLVQAAGADDRVVLVAGNDSAKAPADRPDPADPAALTMIERMGANLVTGATLFRLWRLSYEDAPKARKLLEALHAQDGGLVPVPAR